VTGVPRHSPLDQYSTRPLSVLDTIVQYCLANGRAVQAAELNGIWSEVESANKQQIQAVNEEDQIKYDHCQTNYRFHPQHKVGMHIK